MPLEALFPLTPALSTQTDSDWRNCLVYETAGWKK